MRSKALMGFVVATVTALVGCEWTSSSDGSTSSWNDNYDIVNFSATYRGLEGAPVAVSTSAGQDTPATDDTITTQRITNEHVGTVGAGETAFSGTVAKFPIIVGSFSMSVDGRAYVDNRAGRLVDEAAVLHGTINYTSGAWSLNTGVPLTLNAKIHATYTYNVTVAGQPGVVATPLVVQTITVSQTGQHVTMQASNGMTFTGQINGMNVPSTVTPESTIVAKFSVASGSDKIVGTLTDNSTQRILSGSWVHGKETLDVDGYAGPATRRNALSTTTTTAAATTTTATP